MYTLRASRPEDGAALVDLWRRSVDATHHFLSAEDRQAIDAEVCAFLPHAPVIARPSSRSLRSASIRSGFHLEIDTPGLQREKEPGAAALRGQQEGALRPLDVLAACDQAGPGLARLMPGA